MHGDCVYGKKKVSRCSVSHMSVWRNGFQWGKRAFAHISCVKMVIVQTEVTSVYVPVDLRHIQTQRGFLENEQSTTGTVCLNGNRSLKNHIKHSSNGSIGQT